MKLSRIACVFTTWSSLLLLPATALAQSSITGVVRDTSGAVLPGVTVEATSPALIEGARTAVTDGQGVFRIVDLRPGPYVVTFTLAGFRTLRREGIVLPAEFTATVNADLAVGALEETITVSGEAPVVDIRSTRAQVQFGAGHDGSAAGRRTSDHPVQRCCPGATLMRETDRSVGGLNDRGQTTFTSMAHPRRSRSSTASTSMIASDPGTIVYNQTRLAGSRRRDERRRRRSRYRRAADQHGEQGRRQHVLRHGHVRLRRTGHGEATMERGVGRRGVTEDAAKSLKKYRDVGVRARWSDQAGPSSGSSAPSAKA